MLDMIKRELLMLVKDPKRLVFLCLAGFAYATLFGLLYEQNLVKHVPSVIYDQDHSSYSRELSRHFADSENFEIVAYPDSEEEVNEMLREHEAYSAIEIPKNFAKDIMAGRHSEVALVANGANLNHLTAMNSAAQDIVADYSNNILIRKQAMETGLPKSYISSRLNSVIFSLRVIGNPTNGYMFFMVIGLGFAAYQQGIFFSVGASVQQEYRRKTLYAAPLVQLFFKIAFYTVMGCISFTIAIAVFRFMWSMPLKMNMGQLSLLALVTSFTLTCFGFCCSAPFRTETRFLRIITLYPVPGFILSGFAWPVAAMPPLLQVVAQAVPQTWFATTIRQLFIFGSAFQYEKSLLALLIIAAVTLTIGGVIFVRKLRKIDCLARSEAIVDSQ